MSQIAAMTVNAKTSDIMELTINQSTLASLLKTASVPAISDVSGSSEVFSCIHLVAKDGVFTCSAFSRLLSVEQSINISNPDSIDSEGEVFVFAKPLVEWVAKQHGSLIKIKYSPLTHPEGNVSSDDFISEKKDMLSKVGHIDLLSKSNNKSKSKWSLDCYDLKKIPKINFSDCPIENIEIKPEFLNNIYSRLAFSSMKKDKDHVYDCLSFQKIDDEVYVATSDRRRCSVLKTDIVSKENVKFNIPVDVLALALKVLSKNEGCLISYYKEKNRIHIQQDKLKCILAAPNEKAIDSFPSISILRNIKCDYLCSVSKSGFAEKIQTAAIVNNISAMFEFKGNVINILSKITGKKSPLVSVVVAEDSTSKNVKVVWGVQHLSEIIKIYSSDIIKMYVPDNLNVVKIIDEAIPEMEYYAMAINDPNYDTKS